MAGKTKFLYGCAVVGIGDFIFKSNVLREIVGASELVKCVENLFEPCASGEARTRGFRRALGLGEGADVELVYSAAGNLRLVFARREDVAVAVRELPRYVAQRACGAHFVQAVVEFVDGADGAENAPNNNVSAGGVNSNLTGAGGAESGGQNAAQNPTQNPVQNAAKTLPQSYPAAVKVLEQRLKIQRNNPALPQNFGVAFLKNNPKTALPCVSLRHENAKPQGAKKREKLDEASLKKLLAADGVEDAGVLQLGKLANKKGKIALIYADGNGLGGLVMGASREQMRAFSPALDAATKAAFEAAQKRVLESLSSRFNLRKIICGGDDLVVVCSADIALPLAEAFLKEFEKESKAACDAYNGAKGANSNLGAADGASASETSDTRAPENLTACAGVAFFNKKFPVHYALTLAKKLCNEAKKHSKNQIGGEKNGDSAAATNNATNAQNAQTKTATNSAQTNAAPPSSLMFHNIQSSNVTDFDEIVKNELTLNRHAPQDDQTRCDFGAYFLRAGVKVGGEKHEAPTIAAFLALARRLKEADSPATRLRSYLTLLDASPSHAQQDLERIWEVYKDGEKAAKYSELLTELFCDLSPTRLVIERGGVKKTPVFDLISFISNAEVF